MSGTQYVKDFCPAEKDRNCGFYIWLLRFQNGSGGSWLLCTFSAHKKYNLSSELAKLVILFLVFLFFLLMASFLKHICLFL